MRLDWLEDILAVLETGSIRAAAERRNVTQPAFSRRIRAIETILGVELFDRSRKPVALNPALAACEADLRRTAAELRGLIAELRRTGREAHRRIVVAAQHAIVATLVPDLLGSLLRAVDVTVRLRSANYADCLALLMTRRADLMIGYQMADRADESVDRFVERAELGSDRLVPVAAPGERPRTREAERELPVIAYPRETFLGRVFTEQVQPALPEELRIRPRVETALTLAALELARKGIGVAWLPESLARAALAAGELVDLRAALPAVELRIVALRLALPHGGAEERLWELLRAGAARHR